MDMNPTLDLTEWRNRLDALRKTMAHTLKVMHKQDKTARQGTLEGTLTALKAFGNSQMEFLLQGFGPNASVLLEPSTTYPPEYALRTTLDQLAQDTDVILRAWQQRLPELASPMMIAALNKADTLAYQSLEPAIHQKLVPNATVVTYFQKATTVRLIPYAPVIFIGLPLSILTSPQDLLAVPHEVGHYIYRYGRVPNSGKFTGSRFAAALNYRFADKPSWCRAWMEEIFADVYGALIGGPAMALGFEALVTDDPRDEFTHDDGEHPVAALRPNIYHAVFEKLGGYERVRTALVQRWAGWQAERGNPTTFTTAAGETVALNEAQPVIDAVVASILKEDLAGLHVAKPWSNELPDSQSLETLKAQFVDYVEHLPEKSPLQVPDLQMAEEKDGMWIRLKTPEMEVVEHKAGETALWIDAIKTAAQRKQRFNMPPEAWMALLDGSGWATEGPGGGAHAH
jgi:hypothetical protein